jgi:hypothetical protein
MFWISRWHECNKKGTILLNDVIRITLDLRNHLQWSGVIYRVLNRDIICNIRFTNYVYSAGFLLLLHNLISNKC